MHYDNKAAINIAENFVFHEKIKHIRIDYHYTRDKLLEGFLQTTHRISKHELADLMTKPLGEFQHNFLSSRFGLLAASATKSTWGGGGRRCWDY